MDEEPSFQFLPKMKFVNLIRFTIYSLLWNIGMWYLPFSNVMIIAFFSIVLIPLYLYLFFAIPICALVYALRNWRYRKWSILILPLSILTLFAVPYWGLSIKYPFYKNEALFQEATDYILDSDLTLKKYKVTLPQQFQTLCSGPDVRVVRRNDFVHIFFKTFSTFDYADGYVYTNKTIGTDFEHLHEFSHMWQLSQNWFYVYGLPYHGDYPSRQNYYVFIHNYRRLGQVFPREK